MGYKNLNKAHASRVISMVEESITKSRRPHARTLRPRQWHIARGGPTVEEKFRRGASLNMTEAVVAAPTFNASHQTSRLFMWRRPLNNATLAAATHKGFGKVSDRISTQVVYQTINKWKARIA